MSGVLMGTSRFSRKTTSASSSPPEDAQRPDLFIYPRGYGWGYGFGVGVRTDLTESASIGSMGSYGWGGAACTMFHIDPKEDLISLVLTQVLGTGLKPGFRLGEEFLKTMYQALL